MWGRSPSWTPPRPGIRVVCIGILGGGNGGSNSGFIWIVIVENAEVTPGFLPNIVRLGRMDARVVTAGGRQYVMISGRIRDFSGIRVSWGGQTVDIRGCWVAGNLLGCTGVTGRLRPVMIFQFDIDNSADSIVLAKRRRRKTG